MKKLILSFVAVLLLAGVAACSGDGSPLSESSAKSALKKEAIFAKDSQVASINIGFQEVNEATLANLALLKAAGVVDYSTEKVVETVTKRIWGGYWNGYYNTTKEVEHVFANVELTDAGKKLVVENPTKKRADIIKDFKSNENYEEILPDYMSASGLGTDASAAAADAEVEVVEEQVAEVAADTVAAVAEEVAAVEVDQAPVNENPNAAYEALLARVNTEAVSVLLGRFEIVNVKEVLCTEDMFKAGKGSCTVLYKFVNKTPFGYVFNAPKQDYIMSTKVNFVLYQDMGWVVED